MASLINKLSIVVPVYNERNTVRTLLERLEAVSMPVPSEIIVVDDGSTDGTTELLRQLEPHTTIRMHYFPKNQGKSEAVRAGFDLAEGDYLLIQDADLEYAPSDIPALINAVTEETPVVYGSRNKVRNPHSSELFFWGGIFLTKLTNLLYGQSLTDVATCYKLFPKRLVTRPLRANNFTICYELTAVFAKQGVSIAEVPISYAPRSKKEGKKIKVWDGVEAVATLVLYRFFK